MHEVKKKISCFLLAVCFLCTNNTANASDQTSLRNIFRWNVTDAVQVWSAQEYRNRGFSLYNDPFTEFLEFGLRYAAWEKIYAGAGYRHQWHDEEGVTVNENRWIAMLGATTSPAAHLTLSLRLRFDGKYYDRSDVRDYLWYRFRCSPSYETHLGKLQLAPFVAVEIFGDTKPESKIFINRLRISSGTSIALGQHFRPRIEYLREDAHNGSTDHSIRLFLFWTI
jgi:hypothetical protein